MAVFDFYTGAPDSPTPCSPSFLPTSQLPRIQTQEACIARRSRGGADWPPPHLRPVYHIQPAQAGKRLGGQHPNRPRARRRLSFKHSKAGGVQKKKGSPRAPAGTAWNSPQMQSASKHSGIPMPKPSNIQGPGAGQRYRTGTARTPAQGQSAPKHSGIPMPKRASIQGPGAGQG